MPLLSFVFHLDPYLLIHTSLSISPPFLSPFLSSSLPPSSQSPLPQNSFPKCISYQVARGGKSMCSSDTAREPSSEALSWLQRVFSAPSGTCAAQRWQQEEQRRACPHWLLAPNRCISLKGPECVPGGGGQKKVWPHANHPCLVFSFLNTHPFPQPGKK